MVLGLLDVEQEIVVDQSTFRELRWLNLAIPTNAPCPYDDGQLTRPEGR